MEVPPIALLKIDFIAKVLLTVLYISALLYILALLVCHCLILMAPVAYANNVAACSVGELPFLLKRFSRS